MAADNQPTLTAGKPIANDGDLASGISAQRAPGEIEQALLDPSSVFSSPAQVLERAGLSAEQRIEILRRWEYDAAESAVALEEGMPGSENDLLRQILLALAGLTGGIDAERVAPTKQHGIPRSALLPKSQTSQCLSAMEEHARQHST
jgi:hypothetical protein